jgi:hypothetical protein
MLGDGLRCKRLSPNRPFHSTRRERQGALEQREQTALTSFYWLVVGVLAVWRISYLLQVENGPWNAFERLRRGLSGAAWGDIFACFYCLSFWVAVPFALILGEDWVSRLVLWPALSAGAIIIESRIHPGGDATPIFSEDEEGVPDVLRQE